MIGKRLLVLLLLASASSASFSQNGITGTWEGKYLNGFYLLGAPKLVVEIYDFKDSMFSGISHLYYQGNQYEHYKIIGWFSKKDSLLVFKEASTISVDLGGMGNCLGTYKMVLGRKGNKMTQYGLWTANIYRCTNDSKVWLEKNIEEIKETPVPVKTAALVKKTTPPVNTVKGKITSPVIISTPPVPVVTAPSVKKTAPVQRPEKIVLRETDVQSLLEIAPEEKDSIKVAVYDNGEIDGDTVSVYEGQTLRIDRKMINIKPIVFYVSLNKNVNPITHLRLVAESLGSIPPCTALMIVTTKTKRYEVHLSSNFNKNATVELFLKE